MEPAHRYYPPDNALLLEKYEGKNGGTCGPSSIAALERKPVQEILNGWLGKGEESFKGYAPIGDMLETLKILGYTVKKKRGLKANTFPYPETPTAIVRIQWLQNDGQPFFWREAGRHTHYVAMCKEPDVIGTGWWVFCNSVSWFRAHDRWGEEYLQGTGVDHNRYGPPGYVSSYLELTKV